MMKHKITLWLMSLAGIVAMTACVNTDDSAIWPPDTSIDGVRAEITRIYPDGNSIDPDSVAFKGVGILYIEGTGFSAVPEENRVFFNGERGDVLEASGTKLKVKIPDVSSDSVEVRLSVRNQLFFAAYKDKDAYYPLLVKSPTAKYKAVDQFVDATGLAVDAQENVYILTTQKQILQLVHPDSVYKVYATSIFITTPCMRVGPDGALYLTRGTKSIYRVEEGGKTSKLVSAKTKVSYFDWDADLNMYFGGKGGTIDLVKPDLTVKSVADYTDYYINSLRVFDGDVYVAVSYQGTDSTVTPTEAIYRHEILTDSLGAGELVIDWRAFIGEGGPTIESITFDEHGEMYIGLSEVKEGDNKAIYKLNAGEYFYPEVLTVPASVITFGEDRYMYINRRATKADQRSIERVELAFKGAPYYGRKK